MIEEISSAIPSVCAWLNVKAALCLFRLCICFKFNFCLRSTDPSTKYSSALIIRLYDLVQFGLSYVINANTTRNSIQDIIDNVWDQSTLPPLRSGLGIPDPQKNHIPAYLVTNIASTISKIKLEEALHSIRLSDGQPLDSQVTEVSLNELFKANLTENVTIQDFFLIGLNHSWLHLCMHTPKPEYGLHDVSRFDSCSYKGGVLVTARPINQEFAIPSPHFFRERIRMRLGFYIKRCNSGSCLDCSGQIDYKGYHFLSVR